MVAAGRALLWPGLLLAAFRIIVISVSAVPVNYFPINSQLPPVARISEPFSFTFSPLTFSSELPMSYSLGNAPKWLSIDSDTRHLFGTPSDADVPPGDVVGVQMELVARDATGFATANATLVVSRNPAPEVEIPLSEQIETIGAYSAPSSLLLYPSRPFSFSFAEQTFRNTEEEEEGGGEDKDKDAAGALLNYYAVSSDSAPLPSWVSFDADNLTFVGTTPPFESLVQPPQTFGFQLVASDVLGFASASIPFSIIVGNHELTADEAVVQLNASHGKPFEYKGLLEMLNIDGRPLRMEEATSVTAIDLPEWLKFDAETWGLSGTPDAAAESSNVTIAIVDRYTDSLNVTISIEMEMELFVSDIPDVNITAGGDLSFDLKRYLFDPPKVDVSIESEPSSPWIHFDPASKKLSGTAPEPHAKTYTTYITVTFKTTMKRGGATEERTMTLHVVDLSTADPTSLSTPKEANDTSRRNLLWLLLPFLLLICIGVILFVLCLHRRRRRTNKIDVMDVSAPIPGTFVNHGSGSTGSSLQDMRKMLDIGPPGTDTIRIVGANEREALNSVASSSNLRETRVVSGPSVRASLQPHAITLYSDRRKPRSDGAIAAPRESWFAYPPRAIGRGEEIADETGLLWDTNFGEGGLQVADQSRPSGLASTTNNDDTYGKNRLLLDVPVISEPFSIQATPEIAYQPPNKAGKYDLGSSSSSNGSSEGSPGSGSSSFSSQATPVVGYTTRTRSNHHRPRSGLGLGIGSRLSRVLKRVSGEHKNRSSNLSSSTTQTTRTSILTTALAEQRQATTAGPSAAAKPTIVHISSRPNEMRHLSRRAGGGDSSPVFFSGGSGGLRKNVTIGSETLSPDSSQSDDGEIPQPSPPPPIFAAAARDSDSSWDRLARKSLGVAHKDLVVPPLAHTQEHNNGSADIGMGVEPLRIPAPPPLQPPLTAVPPAGAKASTRLRTPEGKGKGRETISGDNAAFQTPTQTSRHRRQAPISQTTPSPPPRGLPPSPPGPPPNEVRNAAVLRSQLPETPTPAGRGGRRPLADRLNESTPGGSVRSFGSGRKRGGGGFGYGEEENDGDHDDDDDDDDIWEDIQPPGSNWGEGGEGESEGGSFAVYI